MEQGFGVYEGALKCTYIIHDESNGSHGPIFKRVLLACHNATAVSLAI